MKLRLVCQNIKLSNLLLVNLLVPFCPKRDFNVIYSYLILRLGNEK